MASSDEIPGLMPPGDGSIPPGKAMTVKQHVIDKGAQMLQSLKPIKSMSQHVCSFAVYSHDMARQIETHRYVSRVNQDFLQCAVYDSDDSSARLIGVEYIVSERIFETLEPDEQKLWHSHGYEIISGLWVNPGVPEMMQKPELKDLAKTYGKFWCTWQVDRGDRLPLGAPALMISASGLHMVKPEMVLGRDVRYKISTDELRESRIDIAIPDGNNNNEADYWMKHPGKGFAVDVKEPEIQLITPFP